MKEIALYTLDIAQNSITAQARRLDITLTEEGKTITLSIRDDGTGMAPELLARVSDPPGHEGAARPAWAGALPGRAGADPLDPGLPTGTGSAVTRAEGDVKP